MLRRRLDFEAVVSCHETLYQNKKESGNSKEQEKSVDAMRLMKQIKNKKLFLDLPGTADIFDGFGKILNEVQQVDILPHERFYNTTKVLD